ncbi:MAG: hypothetical protein J6D18_01345 [Erysipelotrichaceae bacterium]|nr:hypothetical protein [Erysipelotrichaceae bacterium]
MNFDPKSEIFYDRVRYLWFFNELNYNYEYANTYPWYKERLCWLNKKLVSCQKLLHYDHFKQFNLVHKKGLSYWSLPDTCISYLLEQRPLIRSAFQYSSPGDESFVQTLVYNSPLYADVFQWKDSEYDGLVTTTWSMEDRGFQRKGHAFIREDLDYLKTCRYLFARKLSGPEGYEMIQEIKKSCY